MLLKGYSSLLSCISLSLLLSFNASAESGRIDYDIDDDGLIEINDLQDLNEIRNHLNGTALYGESTGCPEDGCAGFELTTDLDFDTNQDGLMDENDTYWNEGLGWAPIGNGDTRFTTVFDGNGHVIRNLFINRRASSYVGLFGYLYGTSAEVRQIGLTGSLMTISGSQSVGSIAGGAFSGATIKQTFSTGAVIGDRYVGGLIGRINTANVSQSFATGSTTGNTEVGGLLGYANDSVIRSNFATGYVSGVSSVGGIIGDSAYLGFIFTPNTTIDTHWAFDTTQQDTSYRTTVSGGYFGATLAQLQCPTSQTNSTCSEVGILYDDWDSSVWSFGTNSQLPGLIFGDKIYRDSDGDGALDEDDEFPEKFAASQGIYKDHIADFYTPGCNAKCITDSALLLNQFPTNEAISLDTDLDGLPDVWNTDCDINCQNNAGIVLDFFPNDSDNDGISNSEDTDDNNDGLIDADADSDGLIEINNFEQFNAIRFDLSGSGRVVGEGESTDHSGCPAIIKEGTMQAHCIGYELNIDLDFDTNLDGVIDENDLYWNEGQGWAPIGDEGNAPFTAIFDGNHHIIRNLYINRPESSYIGLFSYVSGESAELRNLGLTGQLMKLVGHEYTGPLVGHADSGTRINQTFSTGLVIGNRHIGGLIGHLVSSTLTNSLASGSIITTNYRGGSLVGMAEHSTLQNNIATGFVTNPPYSDGILGNSYKTISTNSHWATDTTQQESIPNPPTTDDNDSYFGATLTQLQCPTASSNRTCLGGKTLYDTWDNAIWDFGNDNQLPGLIFGNTIYRDSDGDGALDEDDVLPFEFSASQDNDNDGFIDFYTPGCDLQCVEDSGLILDQFPTSGAVSLDADLDGLPDTWNSSCNLNCQNLSGVELDPYLGDSDNDGIPNSEDTDDTNDGIIDADADSDGLIDINTLEQLNAMRFDLSGHGRVLTNGADADHSGCPFIVKAGIKQPLCFGYELTADLDFDTNQDGVMDANDTYWNDGNGWQPVGQNEYDPFTATFDGNGHIIRNLYINGSQNFDDYVGLLGYVSGEFVELRNIGLTGPLMKITGRFDVGALAGHLENGASIKRTFSTGTIIGNNNVGGLVGSVSFGTLSQSFSSAAVLGDDSVGGLIGYALNSSLSNNIATGNISGIYSTGGIIGISIDTSASGTYWAIDTTQQNSIYTEKKPSYFGTTLVQLQCPTGPTNINCSDEGTLYEGWNNSIWDFGTFNQLPGLTFGDTIYRDSDGDGSLDEDDDFPTAFAASVDNDNDGYPDLINDGCDIDCLNQSGLIFDQFTGDPSAGQDTDFDGQPDEWAPDCNLTCQNNSSLTLDSYINDSDNDGITNTNDTDDNNDGIPNADIDSNGLIEINNLSQLNAMRFNLSGSGRVLEEGGDADQSGCPAVVNSNTVQPMCSGYELTTDLDFDTNQDGVMDANDAYWNDGLGWEPVGIEEEYAFTAVFNGSGHVIQNLYINRPSAYGTGLFGFVSGGSSELSNIALTGNLMKISGGALVGALVGQTSNGSIIKNTFSNGVVQGSDVVGGLIGFLHSSTLTRSFSASSIIANNHAGGLVAAAHGSEISNSFAFGTVNAINQAGGLVGWVIQGQSLGLSNATSTISNSYAIGKVVGEYYVGGLIGESNDLAVITHSYWATDTTTQLNSDGEDEFTGYIGTTLNELKCPTSANNTSCVLNTNMYEGWGSDTWHFGNESELPGLIIGDLIYRNEAPISIEDWNIENQQFESITPINNAPANENTNNEARSTGGSGGGSVHFLWWVILSSGLAATRKTLAR